MEYLPVPRFEFRWSKIGESWNDRICVYSLVLPLGDFDIRRTDSLDGSTETVLEIGKTRVSGGVGEPPISDDKVHTPFRDYSHAKWDNESLGGHIPIVAVCGDAWNFVE